jgi:hypothetical protein
MKACRVLIRETREGFRLLVAWLFGFISFGFLSEASARIISYFEPWKRGRTSYDEAELLLLWAVIGVGLTAISVALAFEGLRRRCGAGNRRELWEV